MHRTSTPRARVRADHRIRSGHPRRSATTSNRIAIRDIVCNPRQSDIVPGYYAHMLRLAAQLRYIEVACLAVRERAPRLRYPNFGSMRFPVPTGDEQAAIVKYLDHVDRKISRYIGAKKKLIKAVAEERDTITHDALRSPRTRSHRLEVAADLVDRQIDRQDDEIYTPVGLFNRGRGIFHKEPMKGAMLGDSTFSWLEEGDLVLSGQFAWEGAIALAGQAESGCVASHRYPVLRGKQNEVESAYLLSFFKTGMGHLLLDYHSRGAAGRNRPLNIRTLMKEKIPIPPLPVQQRITEIVHLEARLYRTVTEITGALREYRARLAADVVTGKVDVREAAKCLPDEAVEAEPLDEIDELPQDESTTEDLVLEATDAA